MSATRDAAAENATLARLHRVCFTVPRPWTAAEIAALRDLPGSFLLIEEEDAALAGFLLGRAVADEAELLTLAVDPARRRQGLGARLLGRFRTAAAARGARRAYLEVAAGNAAAQALYLGAGWQIAGRRRGYYRHPDGQTEDAVILSLGPGAPD